MTMATDSSSQDMEKKRKIGGKRSGKIVMKKLDCKKKRQIAFTKRRRGIISKAAQLCALCDAQVAFIAQSEGKRVFTYPTEENLDLDAIIDSYLGHGEAHAQPAAREFDEDHDAVRMAVEWSEKQAQVWPEFSDWRFLWELSAETMNLEELELYEAAVKAAEEEEAALVSYFDFEYCWMEAMHGWGWIGSDGGERDI